MSGGRHNQRDSSGKFAPTKPKHVKCSYPAAAIRPADFRPDKRGQVTQTAGMTPDPPAKQQAAPQAADSVPYAGDSPTGFDPYTLGTF